MRGLFTAGILDVFMDENIHIDGIVGVSAGAVFSPNFYSKQRGRALRYNLRFCRDRRYMSIWSLLFTGNMINKQFAFYDVTNQYDIFDNETFMQNNTGFYAVVTNMETGEPEYFEIRDVLKELEVLRASSAIPMVSKPVILEGKPYLDGGISDSIPVLKGKELGYDKLIVVLTRPEAYKKEPFSERMEKFVTRYYKKYPRFAETMIHRSVMYNETLETIRNLEERGEIFVFRPREAMKLKTIERNPKALQGAYDLGVSECRERLAELQAYLQK
ncbi:MAG: patatin family protein [Ruminococcaceae bacterium]|nr:patatin family protein [Oscillospiraceae bacterium]